MDLASIWRMRKLDVVGRRVFVRVDLDAGRSPHGAVLDDLSLRLLLPLLRGLREAKAKVLLGASFASEPGDVRAGEGVATRLGELLGAKVGVMSRTFEREVHFLEAGQVVLTPNLAAIPEDRANDAAWAADVAAVVDVYVLDGLRAAYGRTATTDALPRLLVSRGAGILVSAALDAHYEIVDAPAAPLALVVGGYSFARVAPLLRALLPQTNTLLLGGGVANTFLVARGWQPGGSVYEADRVAEARSILADATARGVAVHLPVDFVVRRAPPGGSVTWDVVPVDRVLTANESVLDIAVATCAAYRELLEKHVTAVWVGLMGDCSAEETQGGSLRVAQAVAGTNRPIAVGDEAVWATTYFGFDARLRLIQGGDAALALLSGAELPGLAALAR